MSSVFGMVPQERQQQIDSLTADWDGENDFSATAGTGIPKGVGMGIMRGGAQTARALAITAQGLEARLAKDEARDQIDQQFAAIDRSTQNAVDYWTPAADEVGKVGQVLGALSEMALPLMAGGGNPSLLAGTQAINTGTRLVDQGVDASTAATVGTAEAGATMLGAWLPILGSTATRRVLGNAVANPLINAGTVAAESSILEGAGYDKQAAQFDPFDWQARAVDVLMGAAFGALARGEQMDLPSAVFGAKGAKRVQAVTDDLMTSLGIAMKPSDMDAAFSAANIKNLQVDSATGRPANPDSWNAHSQAMEIALRQLTDGEPIDVAAQLDGSEFHAKPQTDYRKSMNDVLAHSDDIDAPGNQVKTSEAMPEPVPDAAAPGAPPKPGPADAAKAEADAEIAAVQQHIDQHGDFDVAVAAGDDGTGSTTRKASQLIEEADAVVQEANTMGQGILAAAKCIMGFGS
jgi:hypothetical protein